MSIISYVTIRLISTTGIPKPKIVTVGFTDDMPVQDGTVIVAGLYY
jgi:hypothetical protein